MPEGGALVALSGGRDSALALHLCLDRFREVRAVYVDTGHGTPEYAGRVASHMGVDLEVVDARRDFESLVAGPARRMAERGLTPNPCALCNRRVKLGIPHGMLGNGETLVTGHYARVSGEGLLRGRERRKDQSYFLSLVDPASLARFWLPLGDWCKEEVIAEVERMGMPAQERESMDLCFDLASSRAGRAGDIVELATGEVVGRHKGLSSFTVGQRKGIGAHGRRMYVAALDPVTDRVYVGGKSDLMCTACRISDPVIHRDLPRMTFEAEVQVRYRHRAAPARVTSADGFLEVSFEEPVRAVAPGQVGVVYDSDNVLAAGAISGTIRSGSTPDD